MSLGFYYSPSSSNALQQRLGQASILLVGGLNISYFLPSLLLLLGDENRFRLMMVGMFLGSAAARGDFRHDIEIFWRGRAISDELDEKKEREKRWMSEWDEWGTFVPFPSFWDSSLGFKLGPLGLASCTPYLLLIHPSIWIQTMTKYTGLTMSRPAPID